MDEEDNIVHIVFDPSKQTAAEEINFDLQDIHKLMSFERFDLKEMAKEFKELGYNEFDSYKLAKYMIQLNKQGGNDGI